MTGTTSWPSMAQVSPQGTIIWFLHSHDVRGGIVGAGWTAQELADELALPVGRVRRELTILRIAGVVRRRWAKTRSGARVWSHADAGLVMIPSQPEPSNGR